MAAKTKPKDREVHEKAKRIVNAGVPGKTGVSVVIGGTVVEISATIYSEAVKKVACILRSPASA